MKKNRKLLVSLLALIVLLNIAIHVNGIPQVTLSSSTATVQEFNPVKLGQMVTDGIASDIQVVDNMAYIAEGRLVIIDVSDPEDPQKTGSYHDGTGSVQDICIIDDLAFIADGSDGLEIINISDPSNPFEIGSSNDGGLARGVSVIGDYAFIADDADGLEVIDITDPSNSAEITQYGLSESYKSIFSAGDLVFISNSVIIDGRLQSSDLTILNVSDINNIVELGSIDPGYGKSIHYSHVSGNNCYFTTHGLQYKVQILDISNLSNLRELGRYTYNVGGTGGVPNKMDVIDDLVYLACGDAGLRILNVSDLSNPVEIAHYYDGGYAHDVQVVGNLAYVADSLDGLEIIQLRDNVVGSSASQSTGNAVIPGFELLVVLFVLLSSICLKKGKKGELVEK
ncbi:MAG: LVIVD repeat-containing protein [Candidatus Hodarchaeales archaeon]|jgi:hypothetical protein